MTLRSTLVAPTSGPWTLVMMLLLACDGGPSGPGGPAGPALAFADDHVSLGPLRSAVVTLRNPGELAVGPVELVAAPVRDPGGAGVPGSRLEVDPAVVPTLNPGATAELEIGIQLPGTLQPGTYTTTLSARAGAGARADLSLDFRIAAPDHPAAAVHLEPLPSTLRQGEVVALAAVALDSAGAPMEGAPIGWTVEPADAGFVGSSGAFVGYRPGPALLVAAVGGAADTAAVTVEARGLSGTFQRVGEGLELGRYTSDLWVHGAHAYLGSWGFRDGTAGNVLFTWSVADPASPALVDSLLVDARTVNDVKVHPDRPLGLITHELSEDARNGVTLLDLSDPARPHPLARFTQGLEPGVHNAWLEGDYAYLVVDGVGNGLRVLDISDPTAPGVVASYWAGESFLHDVYVRDGLAFLSHWNAGLVVLDVGHGIAGGSPTNPVEVSRLPDLGGQTHNAWYWPEAGYAFVGEEDFATPGRYHVVDLRDLRDPRKVATFDVPDQAPHNAWLDEERGILYLAWYGQGVRALDVTGELVGDLSRQGREIAGLRYNGGAGTCSGGTVTCAWAPQLHGGLLYVSDRSSGLVVLRPLF